MFKWSANKWFRKTGVPVQDAHLWKDLNAEIKKLNTAGTYVEVKWVKGHAADEHNKAVDRMARKASRLPPDKIARLGPISIFQPKKLVNSLKLEIGSVNIQGQKISIKILSCKLLKPQNLWCYQYQVVSSNNPFRDSVDQIFSTISLEVNKSYYVKFNSVQKNPRIEKFFWEIK
jgi:RNase H